MLTAIFVVLCLIALFLWWPAILSLVVFIVTATFNVVVFLLKVALQLLLAAGWLVWLCVRPRAALAAMREHQARKV